MSNRVLVAGPTDGSFSPDGVSWQRIKCTAGAAWEPITNGGYRQGLMRRHGMSVVKIDDPWSLALPGWQEFIAACLS